MRAFIAFLCVLFWANAKAQELPQLVLPLAHTGFISTFQFSDNGHCILTSSTDGTAKVWNKYSGKLKVNLDLGDNEAAIFLGKSDKIISYPTYNSTKENKQLRIWDANTGELLSTINSPANGLLNIAASPTGRYVMTCAEGKRVTLWDVEEPRLLLTTDSFTYKPSGIVFSLNEGYVAVYSNETQYDNQVQFFEVKTGVKIANYSTSGGPIANIAFSPDEKQLLINMFWHETAYIFETQSGDYLFNLTHDENMRKALYHPNNKNIITISQDQTVCIWSTDSGSLNRILKGHTSGVERLAVSPNGEHIVTASGNGMEVILWSFEDEQMLHKWEVEEYQAGKLECTNNGQILYRASTPSSNVLHVWNAETYEEEKKYKNANNYFVDGTGRYLYISDYNAGETLYNAKTGTTLYTLGQQQEKTEELINFSENNIVMHRSRNGITRSWDANTGNQLQLFNSGRQGKLMEVKAVGEDVYYITSFKNEIRVWKNENKRPLYTLNPFRFGVVNVLISKQGNKMALFDDGGKLFSDTVCIYQLSTGKKQAILTNVNWEREKIAFTPDEDKLITTTFADPIYVWDLKSQQQEKLLYAGKKWDVNEKLSEREYRINENKVSPQGKHMATYYKNHSFFDVWDLEKQALANRFNVGEDWGNWEKLEFSPNETQVAVLYFNFDLEAERTRMMPYEENRKKQTRFAIYTTGKKEPQLKREFVEEFAYSPDGKYIAIVIGEEVQVYDTEKLKLYFSFNKGINKRYINNIHWFNGSQGLLAQNEDNEITIVHLPTKQTQRKMIKGWVKSIDIDKDRIISYNNSTVYFTQLSTAKEQVSLSLFSGREAVRMTPEGYYYASPEDAPNLSWKYKGRNYDFNRWDIQYNRPDKVLQAFGSTDDKLIDAYQAAWQKRVRNTNADTTLLSFEYSLPEVEILNAQEIEGLQSKNQLQLKIRAREAKKENTLQTVEVSINGNPVFGVNGINLNNAHDTTLILPVTLSKGDNKIKVSCTNSKGVQALEKTLYSTCTATDTTPQLWYIGIGVSEYSNRNYNLKYARKDVQDMATVFKQKYNAKTLLIIDSEATLENIKKLKQRLLNETRPQDKIILSLSGHGTIDKGYDFYFATHDMEFKNPAAKGLSYNTLTWLLDSIPARQKLVLMDACHSGEVDKEALLTVKTVEQETELGTVKEIKSGIELLVDDSEEQLGLRNTFKLMQEIFAGNGQNNGATVISAAAGTEFAFEGNKWKNGVFTYSILKGLTENLADANGDGTITVTELQTYVADQVEQLTNGKQRPTNRQANFDNNWVVWEK